MPDLSQTASRAWLRQIDANEPAAPWPPAFRTIEDQGDAPGHWEALGRILDHLAGASADALSKALRTPKLATALRAVLAQAGAARVFRFIHWLDETKVPDSYAVLTSLTEGDSPEATALRATIIGFNRRAILYRIFAPERVAALQAATERAMTETSQ
jgi:hypothetical protein